MGWTSGWYSRAELVSHLTNTQRSKPDAEGRSAGWEVLKKTFRGNNLWTVIERTDYLNDKPVKSEKFICLFMIQKFGADDWGYKDVSASMGPTYYNCPISWFDEVPVSAGEFEAPWRAACIEAANKVKSVRGLQDGELVSLPYDLTFTDGVKENLFTVWKCGRKLRFRRKRDGALVRMSKRQQENLTRPEAPAMPAFEVEVRTLGPSAGALAPAELA